jgi:hypothetical protein
LSASAFVQVELGAELARLPDSSRGVGFPLLALFDGVDFLVELALADLSLFGFDLFVLFLRIARLSKSTPAFPAHILPIPNGVH